MSLVKHRSKNKKKSRKQTSLSTHGLKTKKLKLTKKD